MLILCYLAQVVECDGDEQPVTHALQEQQLSSYNRVA